LIQEFQEINTLEELGRFLKNEREKSGITLEKMQKDTKIRYKYLQSIEEGNFSVLPGSPVYTLGFLKSYARAIDLNEREIIEKYRQIAKKDSEPLKEDLRQNIESQEKIKIKVNRPKGEQNRFIIFGICVLAFFIFVFFGSILLRDPQPKENQISAIDNQQMKQQEQTPEETLPVSNNNEELQEPAQPEIEVIEESENKIVYLVKDDKLEVSVEAITGRCWIRVLTDGNFQYEETIKPGDVRTVTGEQQVFIRVGNPGALKITANENNIDIAGGKPRDIIFERGA